MYTSTNSGATWMQSAWSDDWTCVASSSDGLNLAAATASGGAGLIYTSGDGGASWTLTSAPTNGWVSLTSSADGTKLAAAAYGQVYLSTDSGGTWTLSQTPAGAWSTVACSADGHNIATVGADGLIATLREPPMDPAPPPSPQLSIGRSGANSSLSWLVPSVSFVLEQSSDLTSPNWLDMTNQPAFNFTNLHHEVTLPRSYGKAFYRLKLQ
jgi:hypothetical protein